MTVQALNKTLLKNSFESDSSSDRAIKNRSPPIFIAILMFLLGVLSFQINKSLYKNLNPLNILLSIIPLLYLNILFLRIVRLFSKFRFRKILENFFAYFQLRFLKQLKRTNIFEDIGLEYSQSTDHMEKLIYIG